MMRIRSWGISYCDYDSDKESQNSIDIDSNKESQNSIGNCAGLLLVCILCRGLHQG